MGSDDIGLTTEKSLEALAGKKCYITEKVDGTNIGISFQPNHSDSPGILLGNYRLHIQFRKNEISNDWQYDVLKQWASTMVQDMWDLLGDQHILFGEWLYHRHTVKYDNLPHYLIGFDVFDKSTQQFLSRKTIEEVTGLLEIGIVPIIYQGEITSVNTLTGLLNKTSEFGPEKVEGIYIKIDNEGIVSARYKFVSPDFAACVNISEHWTKRLPREVQGLAKDAQLYPAAYRLT